MMEDEIDINHQYQKFFRDDAQERNIVLGTETQFKTIPPYWTVICSCEIPKKGNTQLLVFIDKHIYIFEDMDQSSRIRLRLLFRRYFSEVIAYTDRSDPRILHVSSKMGKKNFKFHFSKVAQTIESKQLLQEKSKVLVLKELQFIQSVILKFEADCLY